MASAQVWLGARIAGVGVAVLAVGFVGLRSGSPDAALTAATGPTPATTAGVSPSASPQATATGTVTPTGTGTATPVTGTPTTPPAVSPTATPPPAQTVRTVVITKRLSFAHRTVKDKNLAKGKKKVTQAGHSGYQERTYEYTYQDGTVIHRKLIKIRVTRKPVTQITHIGTKVTGKKCDPNYSGACVPIASDVDCAGGSGNGPKYVQGPVRVIGKDIYGLDSDHDGIGCE